MICGFRGARVQDVWLAERPARQCSASLVGRFQPVQFGNELNCRPKRARLIGFFVYKSDEMQPFAGFGRAAELGLWTENTGDQIAFPITAMDRVQHQLATKTDVDTVVFIASVKECSEIY